MPNLISDPQVSPLISNNQISVNPPSHNLSKSTLIGILIFILLSLTAYGAYWYTKSYLVIPSSQPVISNVIPETSQTKNSFGILNNQTTPASPIDETAGWKTYRNEKYGFEFKYPDSLIDCCGISGPSSGKPENLLTLGDKSVAGRGGDAPFDGLAVYVDHNTDRLSFSRYIEQEKQALLNVYRVWENKEPGNRGESLMFVLAGKEGSLLKGYSWDGILRYYVNFPDGQKILNFSVVKGPKGNFDSTFDQILSTFKFL